MPTKYEFRFKQKNAKKKIKNYELNFEDALKLFTESIVCFPNFLCCLNQRVFRLVSAFHSNVDDWA